MRWVPWSGTAPGLGSWSMSEHRSNLQQFVCLLRTSPAQVVDPLRTEFGHIVEPAPHGPHQHRLGILLLLRLARPDRVSQARHEHPPPVHVQRTVQLLLDRPPPLVPRRQQPVLVETVLHLPPDPVLQRLIDRYAPVRQSFDHSSSSPVFGMGPISMGRHRTFLRARRYLQQLVCLLRTSRENHCVRVGLSAAEARRSTLELVPLARWSCRASSRPSGRDLLAMQATD